MVVSMLLMQAFPDSAHLLAAAGAEEAQWLLQALLVLVAAAAARDGRQGQGAGKSCIGGLLKLVIEARNAVALVELVEDALGVHQMRLAEHTACLGVVACCPSPLRHNPCILW